MDEIHDVRDDGDTDRGHAPQDEPARTPEAPGALRDVLTRVAIGDLDPQTAAALLQQAPGPAAAAGDPGRSAVRPEDRPRESAVAGLTISATGVRVTVVPDPSVATVLAEGPHQIHQEGDRLVLELPDRPIDPDGFTVRPGWQWGKLRVDWPLRVGKVRVNPALPIRLDLTASDAQVRGTRAPLEFGCLSGSLNITDHRGPLRGTVTTGSARIEAQLSAADDALSCDMSSLKLTLLAGSDTTVTATAEMGAVKFADGKAVRTRPDDITGLRGTTTATVGSGRGALAIAVRMGSGKVMLP